MNDVQGDTKTIEHLDFVFALPCERQDPIACPNTNSAEFRVTHIKCCGEAPSIILFCRACLDDKLSSLILRCRECGYRDEPLKMYTSINPL